LGRGVVDAKCLFDDGDLFPGKAEVLGDFFLAGSAAEFFLKVAAEESA